MIRPVVFSVILWLITFHFCQAQRSYYTVIQGGGTLGLRNPGYDGAFSGYSLHFIFGKNFDERAFLGIGLGSEALKGDYRSHAEVNSPTQQYDRYLFPIFVDFRLPLIDVADYSRIGVTSQVGYAPKIGPVYDRGAIAKAGVFYLFDTFKRTKFTTSLTYGLQTLRGNFYGLNFNHQQLNLSIGMMFK